jgi:hypothetical protein
MIAADRTSPSWRDPSAESAVRAAFALRARSLGVLDTHRDQLARSRQLVERSRALCASTEARWPARPALVAVPAWHREVGTVSPAPLCARSGCAARAVLQPWFVVDVGGKRVVLGNVALRVCAAHRDDLGELFAAGGMTEPLRARLDEAARSRVRSARVVFEVLG